MPTAIDLSLVNVERFFARVDRSEECWLWTGRLVGGYGRYSPRRNGRQFRWMAHRVSLALTGQQLSHLPVDHLCRQRACVRPDHLEQVTTAINTMRAGGPVGTALRAWSEGMCINGHEIAVVGTHAAGKWRTCAECGRQKSARYKQRRLARLAGEQW